MNSSTLAEANELLKQSITAAYHRERAPEYDHRNIVNEIAKVVESAFFNTYTRERNLNLYVSYGVGPDGEHADNAFYFNVWLQRCQREPLYRKAAFYLRQDKIDMHRVVKDLQAKYKYYIVTLLTDGVACIHFQYVHPTWNVLALAVPTRATLPTSPVAKLARLDGDHRVALKVRDMLIEDEPDAQ